MTSRIVLFSALLILVVNASLAANAEEENPKIKEIRDKVNKVLDEERKRIDIINNISRDAKDEIKKGIKQLEAKVKAAKKANKEAKKKIEQCGKELKEATKGLNTRELENCKGKDVANAGRKIGNIAHLNKNINRIIPNCQRKNSSNVNACVENEVQNIEKQLNRLKKEVDQLLDGVDKEKVKSCVDKSKAKLESNLKEISQKLDTCLEKAKTN